MYDEFEENFEKSLRGEDISIPIIAHPRTNELSKLGTMIDFGKSMSILFGGEPGCLSGDTIVSIDRRNGNPRNYTLKTLYNKFHKIEGKQEGGHYWRDGIKTEIVCYAHDKGYISRIEIKDVVKSGIKEVFEVKTKSGKIIKATKDHKFLVNTDNTFKPLEQLSVGDNVYVKTPLPRKPRKKRPYRKETITKMPYYYAARTKVVNCKKTGNSYTYKREFNHRIAYDAGLNNVSVEEFIDNVTNNPFNEYKFSSRDLEIHHIDEDINNNTFTNLVLLSKEDHCKVHGTSDNHNLHFRNGITKDPIISIESLGEEMTYDVCCKDPYHNFLANDIVVHNSGKTAQVESMFIINLYEWWKRNKHETKIEPFWILRSMERARYMKIAKWTAYLMYIDYSIIIDVPTIFMKSNMSYDIKDKFHLIDGKQVSYIDIIKSYKPYFNEMSKRVDIKSGTENPTGVYKYAEKKAFQHGKYILAVGDKVFINNKDTGQVLNESETVEGDERAYGYVNVYGKQYKIYEFDKKYVRQNENHLFIHITDHIGKLTAEKDAKGNKEILDLHSYYMTSKLRDLFQWTTVDIMQIGRAIDDTYRQVKMGLDINKSDFKGSGNPYEDADIVIGMTNPYKHDIHEEDGYDISRMVTPTGHNRFRRMKVLKNSYGIDDFKIGYYFQGETGFVHHLPTGKEMTPAVYDMIQNNDFNRY